MKKIIAISLALLSGSLQAQPVHPCAEKGSLQAKRLLEFHFGPDDRIEIGKNVRVLPSIKNPSNKNQKFDVLDYEGYIYKGNYRIRLIYAQMGKCLLMGQEILEEASL